MTLHAQVLDDLKTAMKARDRDRMAALRLLIAAIKNKAIDEGLGPQGELDDDQVQRLVTSETKRRREAAKAFRSGDREEQAAREDYEAKVYSAYLPTQLDDDELSAIVDQVITELGAQGRSDMGRVIGAVMGRVGTSADGTRVAAMVGPRLG